MCLRIAAAALAAVSLALAGAGPAPAPAAGMAFARADRLVVQFAPGLSRHAEDAVLARAGARRIATVPALDAAIAAVHPNLSSSALTTLRHDVHVAAADPDGVARALGEGPPPATGASIASVTNWQVTRPELPLAWQVTTGPGVVVAVVDTGVQPDHPALRGRVLPGYDFVNADDDAADDDGHGTAVAGVIAADGEGAAGACTGCRILPVKVLAANGTGDWGTIAAGIVWAADHGAQVINLSFGAPHALDVVAAAVAYAESKGAIVVAAAGNAGVSVPFYPAAYPGVISVAGVDQNDVRYSWSNFGSWVTVAAPGCMTTTWLSGGYTPDFCGTSTAAPFVAGLAGLARSFRPTVASTDFASALARSAAPVADAGTAAGGRVDANGMLVALGAPTTAPVATTAPAVARTPTIGRSVKAASGIWRDAASYAYRWQRSRDGAGWQDVGSSAVYAPRAADRGYRLRVIVTAANARGSATAVSAASRPITNRRR